MVRYTPLANPPTDPDAEMDAAFDNSDEEEEAGAGHHESSRLVDSAPLLSHPQSYRPVSAHSRTPSFARAEPPVGTYDFEYDYPPPPGSPPHNTLSTPAYTAFGNSNGQVPMSPVATGLPRPSVFQRATRALLPARFFGRGDGVGGGTDGVFGNVVAQTLPDPIRRGPVDPNEPIMMPEDAQKEAPPSYAVAQQDAVPPYWETTIVTPGGSTGSGDVIIDNLPTGSLFSFMWNLLVSMSFQFVGFLLTYIMHTTHAAKFGSRAGFGITLVQYGFYLRGKGDTHDDGEVGYGGTSLSAYNSTTTSAPSSNSTFLSTGGNIDTINSPMAGYFSFLLMTMGWFLLISSALGYWRVKRLEAGIRSSNYVPPPPRTAEEIEHDRQLLQNIENAFGIGLQLSAEEMEEGLDSPQRPRRANLWSW